MAIAVRSKRRYRAQFEEKAGPVGRICPACGRWMRPRQQTFAVYIPPETRSVCLLCRYCPACDLLETPWDALESRMSAEALISRPDMLGAAYLVLGTMDEAGPGGYPSVPLPTHLVPELLYEFREVIGHQDHRQHRQTHH